MPTLVTKHELARIRGFDHRAIVRFNIPAVGQTSAGRFIYDLDEATRAIDSYLQSRRLKAHLSK
jgi:hypothetical protein